MRPEMTYIMKTAELGSFAAAARALYLTQPALSMAVARVEKEIGAQIFDRSQKPLRPTAAGEIYLEKAERIKETEEDLRKELDDLAGLKGGTLRIGASHYMMTRILAPVLAVFAARHPKVEVELLEGGSRFMLDLAAKGGIDLTLGCGPDLSKDLTPYEGFDDRILLAVPKGLAVNKGLRDRALAPRDIRAGRHKEEDLPAADLALFQDVPFVLLKPDNNLYGRCVQFFDAARVSPRVALSTPQLVTALHLAKMGLGAAFVSDRMAEDAAGLVFYKIDHPLALRSFSLLAPKRRYLSSAARGFIKIFRDYWRDR